VASAGPILLLIFLWLLILFLILIFLLLLLSLCYLGVLGALAVYFFRGFKETVCTITSYPGRSAGYPGSLLFYFLEKRSSLFDKTGAIFALTPVLMRKGRIRRLIYS